MKYCNMKLNKITQKFIKFQHFLKSNESFYFVYNNMCFFFFKKNCTKFIFRLKFT